MEQKKTWGKPKQIWINNGLQLIILCHYYFVNCYKYATVILYKMLIIGETGYMLFSVLASQFFHIYLGGGGFGIGDISLFSFLNNTNVHKVSQASLEIWEVLIPTHPCPKKWSQRNEGTCLYSFSLLNWKQFSYFLYTTTCIKNCQENIKEVPKAKCGHGDRWLKPPLQSTILHFFVEIFHGNKALKDLAISLYGTNRTFGDSSLKLEEPWELPRIYHFIVQLQ